MLSSQGFFGIFSTASTDAFFVTANSMAKECKGHRSHFPADLDLTILIHCRMRRVSLQLSILTYHSQNFECFMPRCEKPMLPFAAMPPAQEALEQRSHRWRHCGFHNEAIIYLTIADFTALTFEWSDLYKVPRNATPG